MKSGLYACAGASATASAAAWAKRFDEPITKESNVYFALKPPLSGRPGMRSTTAGPGSGSSPSSSSMLLFPAACSATRSSSGRSAPVTSRIAAPIRPRKWPSIQSRVKSFGTPRTKQSSESSRPVTSPNQVPYVVSLREPLSRPATSLHRLSAVSSIWCSTLLPAPHLVNPGGEHSSVQIRDKTAGFAGIYRRAPFPPQVWTTVGETPAWRIAARCEPVEKPVDDRRLYLPLAVPLFGGISLFGAPFS